MLTISAKIRIERPANDVYTFISDYQNDWKWRSRYLEVQVVDPQRTVEFISARTLSLLFSSNKKGRCRILVQVPPNRLVSEINLGKGNIKDDRQVKSLGAKTTEFAYTLRIKTGGVIKFLHPLLFRDFQRDFRKDLYWLKELLVVISSFSLYKTEKSNHLDHPQKLKNFKEWKSLPYIEQ